MLLQLLPHALRREQRSALAVFCDIKKAYDTVDRPFLWRIMGQLGIGGHFLRTVRALHSHTSARSCVRGAMSRAVRFSAGVRQGCPLAPLLYLFVGQALGRFLAGVGVGITLQGVQLACSQYADDVTAFLPDETALPAFLQLMQVFGDASGQRLHPAKSQAMLLGARTLPPVPPPSPVRLVRAAEALGVTFREGVGPPTTDWQAHTTAVLHRFGQLAALPLSAMGRGLASAAYGISRLLFYAEFVGLPPAVEVAKITRAAVALVDSGLTPGRAAGRRFHGVAAPRLLGSPGAGGFGMLPVTEHVRARHAVWGARLVCALAQPLPPLWAVAARSALGAFSHVCHPLALLAWRPSPPERACLPASLLRLCDGLAAVPPIEVVNDALLEPGPWCATAPLWHNPLLPATNRAALAAEFPDLAGAGLTTVAGLGLAAAAVTSAIGLSEFHALAIHMPGTAATSVSHSHIRSRLHDCVARLPPSWLVAAMAGSLPPSPTFASLALPRLGWRFPDGIVQLGDLTVRAATWAQLQRVYDQRQRRHAGFVAHVFAASARPAPLLDRDQVALLQKLLPQLWLPWTNQHKEVYWRLTLDALPTAARLHNADSCICGAPAPDRMHHFWSCPVAVGLIAVLSEKLSSRGLLPSPLLPLHVLLAQPPSSRLHVGLWQVVCLATICALDHVRRACCAIALAGVPSVAAHTTDPVPTMINRAVARFWDLLTEFCVLDAAPLTWQCSVAAAQPFVVWNNSWTVDRS